MWVESIMKDLSTIGTEHVHLWAYILVYAMECKRKLCFVLGYTHNRSCAGIINLAH